MEFVLNTTTSTPDTSRSGSVMHFGDYREDEEAYLPKLALAEQLVEYFSDSDDEDTKLLEGFNELSARHRLTSGEHCTKINLDRRLQQELGLEIGVNVSHEHPWKQIRRSDLLCHLPDSATASDEIKELHFKLSEADDIDWILVGYAQPLIKTDESNTFLVYAEPKLLEDSVIDLIRNLELFERVRTEKTIHKRARPWQSLGSEKEVNLKVDVRRTERIEIEVQRVSVPSKHHARLELRLAEDVRDGYVELLPKAADFDCVQRKRVSIGIQAAAQRVHSEQQTDPTFPTNAWAQYCYVMPGAPCSDAEIQQLEEDAKSAKSKENQSLEQFEISENIENLIKALEFNTIDIYRDDYSLISGDFVTENYVGEMITEAACYLDFEKSSGKFAVALAWHPTIFGLFAIAYSHDCLNILSQDRNIPVDEMHTKSVLRTNYTLLWSFTNSLHSKLVLNSPREITTLSFCPRDGNLLVGGMSNGQFVIWDLQSHLIDLNEPKVLKRHEKLKRNRLHSFMDWSKCFQDTKLSILQPIAITSVEQSHRKPVSVLYWLNEEQCGDGKGLIRQHIKHGPNFKLLLTASIDGSISLWDVDGIHSNVANLAVKGKNGHRRRSSSSQKAVAVIRPIHSVACDQPITSLIFGGVKLNEVADRERFLLTTCMGTISDYSWDDFRELKSDTIKQIDTFGAIHNGCVLRCVPNPCHSDAFLSIGWHIFAIWCSNSTTEPVLWRRRETIITCAAWSTKRATMFFIAMHDGVVEVWDIAVRRDIPVITYDSGLTLITVITQNADDDRILIADGKANTRTLLLHNRIESTDGKEEFKQYMQFGTERIRKFNAWREQHIDVTTDQLEVKEPRREDSKKFIDTGTTEDSLHAKKKSKRNKGSRLMRESATEYSDDLRRRYEKRSVKSLISTLLQLKQLNLETIEMHIKPEKDRQLYNLEKKRAIEKSFRQMHEEISDIRAKLTVPEEVDEHIARMEFIDNNAATLCEMDSMRYDTIAAELDAKTQAIHTEVITLSWHEFLERAKQRRVEMNRALYEQKRRVLVKQGAKVNTTKTLNFDCTELTKNIAK